MNEQRSLEERSKTVYLAFFIYTFNHLKNHQHSSYWNSKDAINLNTSEFGFPKTDLFEIDRKKGYTLKGFFFFFLGEVTFIGGICFYTLPEKAVLYKIEAWTLK